MDRIRMQDMMTGQNVCWEIKNFGTYTGKNS